MYFFVDTAKRSRINHYEMDNDWYIGTPDKRKYKTIKAGEKCLVFCNGTIGQGRLAYNYKKEDAIKMLKGLIKELKEN